MVRDRLVGALCLGFATATVGWGGHIAPGRPPPPGPSAAPRRGPTAPPAGLGALLSDSDPVPDNPGTTTTADSPTSTTATTATTPTAASRAPADSAVAGGRRATASPPSSTAAGRSDAPIMTPAEANGLAVRAVLGSTDLPSGFAAPGTPSGSPRAPDGDSPFDHCLTPDARAASGAVVARARSGPFVRPDTGTVSSSSVVFDRPTGARQVLATLSTPAGRSCFGIIVNARLARNPRLSDVVSGSVAPLAVDALADGAAGLRFSVSFPARDVDGGAGPGDPPVPFVADFVFVRRGPVVAEVEFDSLHEPFPEAVAREIAMALAWHL